MARGRSKLTISPGALRADVFRPRAVRERAEVGGERHRRSLEDYARAKAGNRSLTVAFGENGSHTDMDGHITLDKTVPKDGQPGERYVALSGLLSHELWHERITAREVWGELVDEMKADMARAQQMESEARSAINLTPAHASLLHDEGRLNDIAREMTRIEHLLLPSAQDDSERTALQARLGELAAEGAALGADIAARRATPPPGTDEREAAMAAAQVALQRPEQRRDQFNILEDGRIETHCQVHEPLEYRRISMLNRVAPRITETYTAPEEGVVLLCPEPEAPVDVHGNPLPVHVGLDGRRRVVVPPGAELPVFTAHPISPARQMRAALLAEAVPEFTTEGKDLHPRVRACLDECRPLIDEGVRGTTRECLDRSDRIMEVLERHGLLDEERESTSRSRSDGGQGGGGQGGDSWDERGDGGGRGEGTSESAGGASEGSDGGGISPEERTQADAPSGSHASEKDVADAVAQGNAQSERHQRQDEVDATRARSNGTLSGSDWECPAGQAITTQETITPDPVPGLAARPGSGRIAGQLAEEFQQVVERAQGPERRQRTGRLDRTRLVRAAVGEDTVFMKPGETIDMDLSVELLLDLSGSMSSQRMALYDAARASQQALERLEVPHAIWGFDSGHGQNANHYELKSIARDGQGSLGALADSRGIGGGGTPTDHAVEFSTTRIGRRREASRMMLVFTDGFPNGGTERTQQKVRDAKRKGITVIGLVFIPDEGAHGAKEMREGMREIFGSDWVALGDVSDLPRSLGKQLRQLMRQRAGRRAA